MRIMRSLSTALGASRVGLLVFFVALAMRLAFWQATADAAWPYSAYYKGDAITWLSYARALLASQPFELGIPLRPPGQAFLVAWLWDGRASSVPSLRFWWCVAGAATVWLFYVAVRRSFGSAVAAFAGFLAAASTGLLMLSTSINNEMPYLFLVMAGFCLWPAVRRGERRRVQLAWGAVQAAACLIRVEHALFFLLVSVWLVFVWAGDGGARATRGRAARWKSAAVRLSPALLAFFLVLAPWHLEAWAEIRRFNTVPAELPAATEQALQRAEAAFSQLSWDEGAAAERDLLPAFCRRPASQFVAATVARAGIERVTAEDFAILDDAFGYRPRPVAPFPFVAIYGGLNFYLANNPHASGGFDRTPLTVRPPLIGGAGRYPRALVAGLPPPQLALSYPPHLKLINRGYRMGWRWIREHPADFLRLAGAKLRIFWSGASLGLTGYNLPLGMSGIRRSVDLLVPEARPIAVVWRLGLLALAGAGLYLGRQRSELVPWLIFAASKIVVTVAFFGYARHGATIVPVVLLLGGLALAGRLCDRGSGIEWRWLVAVAILLVAVEGWRWHQPPTIAIDGRQIGAVDPWPAGLHADRRIDVDR